MHTPKSGDFVGAGTVEQVLQSAQSAGVDILVLTDHNSIDGYLEVADRLDAFKPMLVLPGIEITCRGGSEGIHVLGIMDPTKLGKRPRWLLNAVGLRSADRHVGGLSDLDVVAACSAIRERGGLVVAAHAASSKGILKSMRGRQLERVMRQCAFDAVELSTSGQRKAGRGTLERLGLTATSTVVSGSDSHRVESAPGRQRQEGPGDRATDLSMEPPWTFDKLAGCLQAAAGRNEETELHPALLDRFREGADRSVVAVWRANDRRQVARAVASVATSGGGHVLVGVRRGGQGGRGLVFVRNPPTLTEVEAWIWEDVRPVPAVQIRTRTVGESEYFEIEVDHDLNPFVFGVDGKPLRRGSGRAIAARWDSPDLAVTLSAFRETMGTFSMASLGGDQAEWLAVSELERLFPWRAYLAEDERRKAIRMVAYRISKGASSTVLAGWAYLEREFFREEASDLVRSIARNLTVSRAKTGLREHLDAIGASRALKRRVTGAFDGVVDSVIQDGVPGDEFAPGVIEFACDRLGDRSEDGEFASDLLQIAREAEQRANDLLGTLVSDEQVRVVVDVLVGSEGRDKADAITAGLVASRSPISILRDGPSEGREIVLVSSNDGEALASGAQVIAVAAPVRDIDDMIQAHLQMDEYTPGHTIPRNELLDIVFARGEVRLSEEGRLLLFKSCACAGLPPWWTVGTIDLSVLADSIAERIPGSRGATETTTLLRALCLLPGDHQDVAEFAPRISRAQSVRDLASLTAEPWEIRVGSLLPEIVLVDSLRAEDVERGGAPVLIGGQSISLQLANGSLDPFGVDQVAAEACARQLKNVSSELLFDVLARGAVERWSTVTAFRSCDEATYLPPTIRSASAEAASIDRARQGGRAIGKLR